MEAAALRGYLTAAIDCRQVTPLSTFSVSIERTGPSQGLLVYGGVRAVQVPWQALSSWPAQAHLL